MLVIQITNNLTVLSEHNQTRSILDVFTPYFVRNRFSGNQWFGIVLLF